MLIKLRNCRLIPQLSGGYGGEYADILIRDDRIVKVGPAGSADACDRDIDCGGKTVLPGLFDLHMHMNWSYLNGEIRLDDFKILTQSCHSARRYLDHGITTVRDLGSPRRVAAAVRRAIQSGLFTGPRILCAGLILNPVSRDCPTEEYLFLRQVSGCDEVLRAAREEIGAGADYVKLYTRRETFLPEEIRTAVRIAAVHSKKTAAHAHDNEAIHLCLDEGVDTIEHGSYIDEAGIEKLKAGGSFLVPTLAVLCPDIATPGYSVEEKKRVLKPLLDANARNISAAYRAGLKLGFGTDTPIEDLDRAVGLEFKMRREYCGMDNVDILLQATKYSAEILDLEGVTGEIREGLAADLIVVDGNPDEDISVMYQKPQRVIAGGIVYR